MKTKTLVTASAALALLAAAGAAHATTVATLPVTLMGSGAVFTGTVTLAGGGTGVLDSSGTFTVDASFTIVDTLEDSSASESVQDIFTGVLSPGGFTITGGTLNILSCTGANTGGICSEGASAQITSASGSFNASGGTVMAVVFDPPNGVTVNNTFTVGAGTFSPPAAVPLPPAVWLLSSGVLGLAGAARRRSASQ